MGSKNNSYSRAIAWLKDGIHARYAGAGFTMVRMKHINGGIPAQMILNRGPAMHTKNTSTIHRSRLILPVVWGMYVGYVTA